MELKDFISQTLFEIQNGVHDAINRSKTAGIAGAINPVWKTGEKLVALKTHIKDVSFDIAVTVSEKSETSANGGIKVMGVGIGGDSLGITENSHVSRIQFSIPIIPPATEIEEKHPDLPMDFGSYVSK